MIIFEYNINIEGDYFITKSCQCMKIVWRFLVNLIKKKNINTQLATHIL